MQGLEYYKKTWSSTDYNHKKQYRQYNHQQNKNN